MANIQIFTSPEFGDIRTVDQNGEPWFVGKDVAAALGYGEGKSLANAVSNHVDEQDKGVTELMTPGGNQRMVIINESGLYSLIFGSKLEGAVRFKRWVTSEVLPALRKTGSYMMPKLSKEMQALFMLDNRTQRQEERLTALENTMTVDYNQQRVLRKAISRAVIGALGGEDTPAYIDNHVRSKVYSECNHDVQDWFRVNSVGNIPRKRFDEAVEYIQRWKPSTNTVMLIQQTNGQTSLFAAAAAQKNTTTAGKFVKEV
nr:MAG TPA: repressor domain protein [Caudoviricetes sp.]